MILSEMKRLLAAEDVIYLSLNRKKDPTKNKSTTLHFKLERDV